MMRNTDNDETRTPSRSVLDTGLLWLGLLSPLLALVALFLGSASGHPIVGAAVAMGFIILCAWSLGSTGPEDPPRCNECGQVLPEPDDRDHDRHDA